MNAAWITGMGVVCAAGVTPGEAFCGVRSGTRNFSSPAVLGNAALPYPFLGLPERVFPDGRRHSARDILEVARLVARIAMVQAGMSNGVDRPEKMGVVVGTTAGCALHFLDGYNALRPQVAKENLPSPRVSPQRDVTDFFTSSPALHLAADFDACGPAVTVANACTSGADAIGMGLDLIRQGRCDVVLCGGADTLDLVPHTGFSRLMIYDKEPCRPFDATRKGLNLGEGAAMLVLESESHAVRRKAVPFGKVLGYGSRADAHHLTAPHPEGHGLAAALRQAMLEAGVKPRELAFVNAHGTATPDNDRVEGNTLARCLPGVPVWASKACTGHTLGAAGALEAVLTVLALREGVIPVSHGFARQDPHIALAPTTEELPAKTHVAASTSLGFGGGNSMLVLSAGGEA